MHNKLEVVGAEPSLIPIKQEVCVDLLGGRKVGELRQERGDLAVSGGRLR